MPRHASARTRFPVPPPTARTTARPRFDRRIGTERYNPQASPGMTTFSQKVSATTFGITKSMSNPGWRAISAISDAIADG